MATKKEKQDEFIKIYKLKAGNISLTCEALGISRQTYYTWRNAAAFNKRCNEVEEGLIDFVESKLMQNIQNNDNTGIIFFLKCKAKHRGYVERQEVEHTGEVQLPANITVEVHK